MKTKLALILIILPIFVHSQNVIPEISTYLGSNQRNYYGNKAPDTLEVLWKLNLGEGISPAYGNPNKVWKGAGWTGQALFIREGNKDFLIQPSFDYNLKKINANTQEIIWEYKFDDILKGSPVLWENKTAKNKEEHFVILQGSRRGIGNNLNSPKVYSYRAISYHTGNELWRMNVKQTISYSRDVDGTAIIINDTAYIPLENGIFTVFSPDKRKAKKKKGFYEPKVYQEINYFKLSDTLSHGTNIEIESAPALLNNRIYTTAGCGRVYGYNIAKRDTDWIFEIGSDLDGSPTATYDNKLLIPVEKDYIKGKGGVYKLNPSKLPENSVEWFYPTPDKKWFHWHGGLVGSVATNDAYSDSLHLAAFVGIDGYLNIIQHDSISEFMALGTDAKTLYPTPHLIYRRFVGGTISTPIFVENKLIVALDEALYLFEIQANGNVVELAKHSPIEIDATPIAMDGKIYIASRDGYLYCFGRK